MFKERFEMNKRPLMSFTQDNGYAVVKCKMFTLASVYMDCPIGLACHGIQFFKISIGDFGNFFLLFRVIPQDKSNVARNDVRMLARK